MPYWSLLFLVAALVAGVLGFGGAAATAGGMARVAAFVFLLLFAVTLAAGGGLA